MKAMLHRFLLTGIQAVVLTCFPLVARAQTQAELTDVSINGGIQDGKARLTIEGLLSGKGFHPPLLFSALVQDQVQVQPQQIRQKIEVSVEVLQGVPKELLFRLQGLPDIRSVTGDALQDWSLRRDAEGNRILVLRPRPADPPLQAMKVLVEAQGDLESAHATVETLSLLPPTPALLNGAVSLTADPAVKLEPLSATGLIPVHEADATDSLPNRYRMHGAAYRLTLKLSPADPETAFVSFRNSRLEGQILGDRTTFLLTGTARVTHPKGGSLTILSGDVALTGKVLEGPGRLSLVPDSGAYVVHFDGAGEYPVRLEFAARVHPGGGGRAGWQELRFAVAPAALQTLALRGLTEETLFDFAGARPEWRDGRFETILPADGTVNLAWKAARDEAEGKLFYAVDLLSQVTVSPGLMRQSSIVDLRVMQGELRTLVLALRGPGEVTRVLGENVLSWTLQPGANPHDRRLAIEFNQAQKSRALLQVQMQTPLAAFPQEIEPAQLAAEGATRTTGYLRVVNEGAVRIEVPVAKGLSQISPEQFPESDLTRTLFRSSGNQRFAYRFAGGEFALKITADQVLPEIGVSALLAYRLGESETTIDAELELEVRDAPLRELLIRIPRGYAVARLTASGLNDYFTSDVDAAETELRLVYGTPVSGRQVVQLRLERNEPLNAAQWTLPRIEVLKAKSTRGHLGVAADAGYRVTPETTRGLTEVATAFFPRKVPGIQAAFRVSDPSWTATLTVQRLPQTIQVDAMHLFSIGEGIAYGSSVLNYLISGAPVSTLNVELSNEYFNVEFTGKDIRHWRKTEQGYLVQLHTPVSGSYTLLATYERPFKPQGETLFFNGARPLDVQSEQGHSIIISAYQFQVTPTQVSPGLLALETGEVPAEYRLFFDAPVLAAYRYSTRPFNLALTLAPLAQGDSLNLVVDRAALSTRISKEGQVLTDVRYFVKNRGNPHFRLTLPPDTQLWSVTVDGARVVPVTDAQENLIPLPQRADPNAVLTVDLKLASRSASPSRVAVRAPTVSAPVMLAEWKLEPDAGRRLVFRSGTLQPVVQPQPRTGWAQWVRLLTGPRSSEGISTLVVALAMMLLAGVLWRWTLRKAPYRDGARFNVGVGLGLVAFVFGAVALMAAGGMAGRASTLPVTTLTFLAPIQQAGSAAVVEVRNVADRLTVGAVLGLVFPLGVAFAVWLAGLAMERQWLRRLGWLAVWSLLLWQALRLANGAVVLAGIALVFLLAHVAWPAFRQLRLLPAKPAEGDSLAGGGPAVTPVAGFFLAAGLSLLAATGGLAAESNAKTAAVPAGVGARPLTNDPAPRSVIQTVRVQDKFAVGAATIRWRAQAGQWLPLVSDPAVMTRVSFPTNSLKLLTPPDGPRPGPRLLAVADGDFEISVEYQVRLSEKDGAPGFVSPLPHGLVNRLNLTLSGLDVEVFSPQAVAIERKSEPGRTLAEVLLRPAVDCWISWRPRSRDVASETPVFYAEVSHLYVPLPGVVEGVHYLAVRPAQGQLAGLTLSIPPGSTVMDVLEGAASTVSNVAPQAGAQQAVASPSLVSLWRFDPDSRQLRLTFAEPQSRPFVLAIRTQTPSGPLPVTQAVGLIVVRDAAGQIGALAVATPPEVQLESAEPTGLSAMNLEDFPAQPVAYLQNAVPGLAVRRAFRYSEASGQVALQARAVEPDIRAETQQTVSLGEDRIVLVANTVVTITRAGIFKLSFVLPPGFDVETISGPALSHWTESRSDAERLVTLHLNGKTEGQQQFSITLAGPGAKPATAWSVPSLLLREATKERGTLLLVPEQGMRLQPAARDNLTQLDPQKSGVAQKGVLAFRVLQSPWRLAVDIEQVDAWIQVNSLQHVVVAEAQAKVTANLQYQIENTGSKGFRLRLPATAENVRFTGEQIADFLPVPNTTTNGTQEWEIKLHRKVIGAYRLQCIYQLLLPENAPELRLRGVVATDVNLQRGFVTIESGGRVQLRVENASPGLQPTEWQSIPQNLRAGLQAAAAHFTFRLAEPVFELPLKLERRQAAKLLPARVNSVTLNSVISDDGGMLTQARIEVLPGDKRLLSLTLPKDGRFWFAFVNQAGVWPWRDGAAILIPLDQQNKSNTVAIVEVFYSSLSGVGSRRSLDIDMVAPKFDLPLENITWRVALDPRWKVASWGGALQLEESKLVLEPLSGDQRQYLESEISNQRERIKQAENLLLFGNRSLEQGDPQQARRAFQAAFGLSTHDAAFNEDARVQLHNLKVQQALVGLNVLQAGAAPEAEAAAGKLQEIRGRKEANYTQQDAQVILQRNTADDNAALTRLAERIVQQQDAVLTSPTAIRASIPEQGLLLTFKRSVWVDPQAPLNLKIEARTRAAGAGTQWAIALGLFALLAILARTVRVPVRSRPAP